jgi:hypothetical protein
VIFCIQAFAYDFNLYRCIEVARKYWAEAGVAEKIEERLGDAKATLDDIIAAGGAGTFDIGFVVGLSLTPGCRTVYMNQRGVVS